MEDSNIATDEARRVAEHERIKSHVEREVHEDIEDEAVKNGSRERPKVAAVAADLRGHAIDDVVAKDREVTVARGLARGSGVIDYIFGVIYGLLAIRLVLALVAARSENAFVQLIAKITDPFYSMFRGIVPNVAIDGSYTLVVPIIIAIVAYALLHAAINGFLRMIANRKTTI
jgi:uncharacterized protein YggT (Ycf19 family)